jgi:hypothetical protein
MKHRVLRDCTYEALCPGYRSVNHGHYNRRLVRPPEPAEILRSPAKKHFPVLKTLRAFPSAAQ